jgi:hypothetical protein
LHFHSANLRPQLLTKDLAYQTATVAGHPVAERDRFRQPTPSEEASAFHQILSVLSLFRPAASSNAEAHSKPFLLD